MTGASVGEQSVLQNVRRHVHCLLQGYVRPTINWLSMHIKWLFRADTNWHETSRLLELTLKM